MSKKIYITPEANRQIELKKYNLEGATLLTKNPIETFEKIKKNQRKYIFMMQGLALLIL